MGKRLITFFTSIMSYFFAFLDEILSPRAKSPTLLRKSPASPKPKPPKNSFPATSPPKSDLLPDPKPEPEPIVPVPDSAPISKYPVFQWPTDFVKVTQKFGVNPIQYQKWGVPAHEGIDMKAPKGTPIRAVWDGEITRIEDHVAYGNSIRIRHEIDGNIYESVYAHFEKPSDVTLGFRVGMPIKRSEIIGFAGTTGNSTGPHLHFMLKQFAGEVPDTDLQKKYEWPHSIIDPTPFFKELA